MVNNTETFIIKIEREVNTTINVKVSANKIATLTKIRQESRVIKVPVEINVKVTLKNNNKNNLVVVIIIKYCFTQRNFM